MDSTPPVGRFMIFLNIAIAGAIGFFLTVYAVRECSECKHTHFISYRSRKIKKCVDCGFEVDLDGR
jgi:ribosomal protein S27E